MTTTSEESKLHQVQIIIIINITTIIKVLL